MLLLEDNVESMYIVLAAQSSERQIHSFPFSWGKTLFLRRRT